MTFEGFFGPGQDFRSKVAFSQDTLVTFCMNPGFLQVPRRWPASSTPDQAIHAFSVVDTNSDNRILSRQYSKPLHALAL